MKRKIEHTIEYNINVDTGLFFKIRMWLVEKLMYIKYTVEK